MLVSKVEGLELVVSLAFALLLSGTVEMLRYSLVCGDGGQSEIGGDRKVMTFQCCMQC